MNKPEKNRRTALNRGERPIQEVHMQASFDNLFRSPLSLRRMLRASIGSSSLISIAMSFASLTLASHAEASVKAFYEIPTQDPQLQAFAIFEIESDSDAYNSNGRAANELRLELPAALTGQPHSFTLLRQAQLGHFAGVATNAPASEPSVSPASATAVCTPAPHDAERGDWMVCDMQFSQLAFDHNLRDKTLLRIFEQREFLPRQAISRQFEGQPIGRLHYRVR
jgi:hypothetical protein